jgi:hypothetical protein
MLTGHSPAQATDLPSAGGTVNLNISSTSVASNWFRQWRWQIRKDDSDDNTAQNDDEYYNKEYDIPEGARGSVVSG